MRTPEEQRAYLNEYGRRQRLANLEKSRKQSRESARRARAANPEKYREMDRRYKQSHPARVKATQERSTLKFAHGMLPEQKAEMRSTQCGRCCYCERPLPEDPRNVHVDHDHSCTCGPSHSCQFCRRGLACNECNLIIGLCGEDSDRLERIAANFRVLAPSTRARLAGRPQQEALPIDIKRAARQEASG